MTHGPAAGIITAIVPSARKPGRFEVDLDGARYVVSIESIERLGLVVGRVLDDASLAYLEREAAVVHAYDRALGMLAARGHSSAALRRSLVRKGEPSDAVQGAIERLQAVGYLDDAAFARQFTRAKAVGAGQSRRRIQQELARKGVARDVTEDAIDEVFAEEQLDDSASIERVARKKLKTLAKLDPTVRRRRLYAFLARRGYDADDIAAVLRALAVPGSGDE